MEEKKVAKVISLLVSVIVLILSLQTIDDWETVGAYVGCGLNCRISYPFYHANLVHAILNGWCLLSVVFIYDISLWRLVLSYIVAVTIPTLCLSDIPTVGLSGVVYFLFGTISFEVQRKLYYQLWMLFYIFLGFIFPNTNALVHLYCYLVGVCFSLLNKPIKIGGNGDDYTKHYRGK